MIALIAAMCSNGVIGNDGNLVCRFRRDMEHFKMLTIGNTVVMGYNTYMSLPSQKPLKGRRNIILSRRLDTSSVPEGFELATSVEDVLEMTKGEHMVFIIGGGKVYSEFMPYAERMFLTYIDKDFDGDTYFPEFGDEWILYKSFEIEDDPDVDFTYYFNYYVRKTDN